MKKIGVIINPHAKKVRTKKISIDEFKKIDPDIVDLRVTNTINELDTVIKDFKKKDITYIGITGGDGSLHHVLTHIINIYKPKPIPPIVILKGGTMDNVSRTIKLKGNGLSILKRLVYCIKAGKDVVMHERDTMKIEDRYCFLFGLGIISNFLNEVYIHEKGFISNMRVIFKAFAHAIMEPKQGSIYEGLEADVYIEEKLVNFKKISAILAGTVESVSPGTKPLYRANEKKGTFHALITGLKPIQIWTKIYFLFGIGVKHRYNYDVVLNSMKIKSDKSFQYTMDGDMYDSEGELVVTIGPRINLVYV